MSATKSLPPNVSVFKRNGRIRYRGRFRLNAKVHVCPLRDTPREAYADAVAKREELEQGAANGITRL